MIKNLLFLIGIAWTAPVGLIAQVCTPNTAITEPGLYPRDLPDAEVGVAYSEVIQFKFPTDTTISGNTVPVDSVEITEVSGFPTGFSYQCNKTNCRYYLGGENGCVVISGSPTASQAGDYNLSVKGIGYFTFGGSVFPVAFDEPLTFTVKNGTFINNSVLTEYDFRLFPNPFFQSARISFNSLSSSIAQLEISDLTGKQVALRIVGTLVGENIIQIDRGNLKEGVYLYTLRLNESVISGRMLIIN